MSTSHCCQNGSTENDHAVGDRDCESKRSRFAGRCRDVVRWLVPSAVLALLPKCPLCIAAYFALGTGLGLSVSAAAHLRLLIVLLCLTSLAYLSAKHLRGVFFLIAGNWSLHLVSSRANHRDHPVD